MEYIKEYQVLISGILYIVFVLFVQQVPRETLYKMGVPFVRAFAFVVNNTLLKIFSKKKAEELEEGFLMSIAYCIKKWVTLFMDTLIENNIKEK